MMLPSPFRLVVSGLAVALLGACDRPTAPQARDKIEKTQQAFFSGIVSLGNTNLERLLANSVGPWMWFPADMFTVERDGETTRYLAHVFERVYLPPAGSPGRPYIKRTLLAWDKENHRGLAFAADDSVADIVAPTPQLTADAAPERIWHHPSFAVQSENNAREAWFGTEGRIDFGVGTKVGPCSLEQGNAPSRFPGPTEGWDAPRLVTTCDDLRFVVSGSTLLEKRRIAEHEGWLERLSASKMPVRFDGQSVRGTRITTQCPDSIDMRLSPPWDCFRYLIFWRDQGQFAAGLGLDVTQIKRSDDQAPYMQLLTPGAGGNAASAPVPHICCTPYAGPAHYMVRTPDGKTVRERDVAIASEDTLLKQISWTAPSGFRDGMRVLLLMNSWAFSRALPHSMPVIVDLTVLPCPSGKRRDNVPGPGHPFATGGCYSTP